MPDVPATSLKPFLELTTSDWENPHYLLIAEVQLHSRVHLEKKKRNLTVVNYDGDDKLNGHELENQSYMWR